MFGVGAFAWSRVVVVCVAFGFICFVLFLFFSFFFFSLGIKGGLKLFLAVVQWVGSFGGLSRQLCPYNLTDMAAALKINKFFSQAAPPFAWQRDEIAEKNSRTSSIELLPWFTE